MKKNNRKGFTIVELVIVIAVIAILAAVLIPTFSNVVSNAKESAAMQEAKSMYTEYVGTFDYSEGGSPEDKVYVVIDDYTVLVENGNVSIVDEEAVEEVPQLKKENGTYTIVPVEPEETESANPADPA